MDENRTVEVCQKAFVSAFVITTKRVRLQREKLIASLGLNSYRSHNRSKKDKETLQQQMFASLDSNDNNNDSLTLNNNTITLTSLKSKYNLPDNLSLTTISSASQNGNSSPKQHQDKSGGYQSPELNSAKKLASMLGKKSLEQLRELNITLERDSSTSCSEDDGPTVKQPPLKRLKKQKDPTDGSDNPLLPFGLVIPDGVTIAPVMGPDHDRDIAIVNNFFNNQLWKPEYIGAYS